ncbi:MAG: ABC transporter permease subunit [Lentisphaerota bacterium]
MMNVQNKNSSPTIRMVPWYTEYLKNRQLLLMLIPGMIFFLIFSYIPMCGIVIAFKNFSMNEGITGSPWCGLDNFRRIFMGSDFLDALRNTLSISVLRLAFGFCAPIALALMLNEIRVSWYKRTIQTITYMPYFFSWVILGGIFLMLFSVDGPVNVISKALYGHPIPFMTSGGWFIFIIVSTAIWQSVGYGAVIYLAALSGIDPSLYEAAVVDGANRWKQTLHITAPCLIPTIITLLILSIGGILNAGFDQIYNMYNPMVYDSADIIDTFVMRKLENMDYSIGTAAGLFKSVVGMALVIGANSFAKYISKGEQGVW